MPTNTVFREITSINQATLSQQLEANLIQYFSWGFLNIGGFYNVEIPQSGSYGGRPYQLDLVKDHRYTNGQVWAGFRKEWVWESGIECSVQPIQISGVNVNNTFYPIGTTGAFSYKIDYPNGRVIFDSAISTTATVTCEYSHRYVQFYNADAPWLKHLHKNSMRTDHQHLSQTASGIYDIPPEQRVQLPAVIVHTLPNTKRVGKEIGSLAHWVTREVRFDVLAETSQDVKFIYDTIEAQWEKSIIGFNLNQMISSTGFPLKYDGTKSENCKTYPDLVKPSAQGGFQWKTLIFEGFRGWEEETPENRGVYRWVVSGLIKTDLP